MRNLNKVNKFKTGDMIKFSITGDIYLVSSDYKFICIKSDNNTIIGLSLDGYDSYTEHWTPSKCAVVVGEEVYNTK